MLHHLKNTVNSFIRFINGWKRPSKRHNAQLLQSRGETIDSFIIREAGMGDIGALATLHVETWNQTYGSKGPGLQIRIQQWNTLFKETVREWFVLVVENKKGELVGFAKGQPYDHQDLPQFSGELNKIYLLKNYQRLGLGRKLITAVARKFLEKGITNMVLFGIPQNPSGAFHEAMGGERLSKKGEAFQGGYGWSDLSKLANTGAKP